MKWRVVFTDYETASGVAPVCPNLTTSDSYVSPHWNGQSMDEMGVWDCCPHPHLQCVTESDARTLVTWLNKMDVEICQ